MKQFSSCRVDEGFLPLSEHEGGLGFSLVVDRRRAADDDGGPTVSSQRILQDSGHLTVPVWDVGFLDTKVNAQFWLQLDISFHDMCRC